MARSLIVYQGEDETPEHDLTDATSNVHIIWEEIEAGGRAFMGESTTNTVPARDEQGETGDDLNLPGGLGLVSLSRGSKYEWLDGIDGGEVRMAVGRIGTKDYSRGRQKADRAREVVMTNGDRNEELTEIIVDDWVRGEETDYARVIALCAAYLNGSPRATTVLSTTYVANANTVTCPAKTYDGVNPKEILSELAALANKNFFVTVDDELWYDVNTSDSYEAGLRISDRPDEVTQNESAEPPTTLRLYWSTSTELSVTPATDAAWEHDDTGGTMHVLQTSPNGSYLGTHSLTTSIGGTAGGQDVCQDRSVYGPLSADEAALIAAGGLVCRGQVRARMRFGIGIDEADQDGIAQIGVRVTQGASSTIRGTALALHALSSSAGSSKWPAAATKVNKQFPPAPANNVLSAVAGCVAGDYLVVEIGCRNFTISSETSGSSLALTNNSASDLPLDDSSTDNFNSWIQFGPSDEALPTFAPKWDVGPASTEDGLELISGLRLYYGEAGAYVTADHPETADEYWHAERSFYTTDPAINTAPKAQALADAILERLRLEERTYNVSIGPLYDEHVGLVKPGQLINIKARAIPDADDQFVSRRIAQLKWTTPRAGVFWARMQLDRPIKELPYGVGPKEASTAIKEHKEGGTHPASNIPIVDSGGYYTGTDVEAALQEIGSGGVGGVSDHGALTGLLDDDHPQYADAVHSHDPPTPGFHGVLVKRTTDFTSTNSNDSVPDFDTELYDTDGMWDAGDPDRLTVPADFDGLMMQFYAAGLWAVGTNDYVELKLYRNVTRPIDDGGADEGNLIAVTQHYPSSAYNTEPILISAPIQVATGDEFFITFRTPASETVVDYFDVSLLFGAWIVGSGGGGSVDEEDVMNAGRWEVVVSGTAPPVAVTNEAEDDWLYSWVSGP